MKIIAHRANIWGPNELTENNPNQIQLAINLGYDCEIDIYYVNLELYLGHDSPTYKIEINFLLDNHEKLWCHCKNIEAFEYLLGFESINCFFHASDDYTLTSKKYIWVYPGKKVPKGGIVVMPEWHPDIKYQTNNIGGICTDYPSDIVCLLS